MCHATDWTATNAQAEQAKKGQAEYERRSNVVEGLRKTAEQPAAEPAKTQPRRNRESVPAE